MTGTFEEDGEPTILADSSKRVARSTVLMAVGTTLSRITGLGRIVALAFALAGAGFADSYNLANTTPNIITDIVIGGVLSATFVPVFSDYLATRKSEEAWRAISAVVTVTLVLLALSTVVFFILAPEIIDLYTVTNHRADLHQQQQVAVFLLRWFVPQLTCYGLIALITALLNARRRFAAPMFVPIANNVVVIIVLLWFHALVPHPSLASIAAHHRGLVLLGIGTTLGVVVQAVLLVPDLRRADLHLRLLWQPTHAAVRTITRLAGWTFGIVLSNQVSFIVILALADGTAVAGGVTAYTYAYAFFQLPYGIITVSVMSAVTPSLSARWAQGDLAGFRHRFGFGLRSILAIIVPSAVGLVLLAHPIIGLVLQHGAETSAQASATASTLVMFALGLPGFCVFLYAFRIFQSMQDTKSAFKLYLAENVITIALGVILVWPFGVEGLALAGSVAYSVMAVVALRQIGERIGGLGGRRTTEPISRVVISSVVMGVIVLVVTILLPGSGLFSLFVEIVVALLLGTGAFLASTLVLGRRAEAGRAGRMTNGPSPTGRDRPGPPAFRDRLDSDDPSPRGRHLRVIDHRSPPPEGSP